jgi:hypothetical protein
MFVVVTGADVVVDSFNAKRFVGSEAIDRPHVRNVTAKQPKHATGEIAKLGDSIAGSRRLDAAPDAEAPDGPLVRRISAREVVDRDFDKFPRDALPTRLGHDHVHEAQDFVSAWLDIHDLQCQRPGQLLGDVSEGLRLQP